MCPTLSHRHPHALTLFPYTTLFRSLGKRIELEGLRSDGSEVKVELSITALRRGRTYLFNGFIRDLTEKLAAEEQIRQGQKDRKSTRLNSSHLGISYAVFCLKKKKTK